MKQPPSHPMPLPGAPPPGQPDAPAHQPVDPDEGAAVLPGPDEEDPPERPPP